MFEYYHYRGSIIKNGKLTGNVFQFNRLFPVNGFNPAEILSNEEAGVPFLYGGKFMNTIYSPDGANGYTLNLDDGYTNVDFISQRRNYGRRETYC